MNTVPAFHHKNGWAVIRIARDLINMSTGDRVGSIDYYSKLLNSGRGTIQYALEYLQKNGCVQFNRKGANGTFLSCIDYEKLWHSCNWGTLICAVPIVADIYIEALLTAIYTIMKKQGIPFSFAIVGSSKSRLVELSYNRYSIAIATKLGYNIASQTCENLYLVDELHTCPCPEPFVLLHYSNHLHLGKKHKMVINPESIEQVYISKKLSAKYEFETLHMSHLEMIHALKEKSDYVFIARKNNASYCSKGINITGISELGFDNDSIVPVIVTNRDNFGLADYLNRFIHHDNLSETYNCVLQGQFVPNYY